MNAKMLAGIAALGLAGPALAQDGFSYGYLDLGYASTRLNDIDMRGGGFGMRGFMQFGNHFHGFFNYSDYEFDTDLEFTGETVDLGLGTHWGLAPNLDIIARVAYRSERLHGPVVIGFSGSDNGYAYTMALRTRIGQRWQLEAGATTVDMDDFDDRASAVIGVNYYFNELFSIGTHADYNDKDPRWLLNVRLDLRQATRASAGE